MSSAPPIVLWMQCLTDQTRSRLLRLVERCELTVAELCSIIQLPQSTVSRHLKVLIADGWLFSRKDGTNNYYRMIGDKLEASRRRLWHLVREQAVKETVSVEDDARLEQVLVDRRSKSQTFFSSAAAQWDRLKTELFGKRIDACAMASMLRSDEVIGDLGCGTGAMIQLISPWVERVIGVDSSSAMLNAAKRRLKDRDNVDLRKGELIGLPIEDKELTSCLMVLVLPYIETPERVFQEAARCCRRDAKLSVIDLKIHDRSEFREELGHTWLGFEEQQIRSWAEGAGWKVSRWSDLPPDPEAKGPGLFAMVASRN